MELTAYYFSDNDLLRVIFTTLPNPKVFFSPSASNPMLSFAPYSSFSYLITPETLAWEREAASDWEGVSIIRG